MGTMNSIIVFSWRNKKRVTDALLATSLIIKSTLVEEIEFSDGIPVKVTMTSPPLDENAEGTI